jgi:hypothetical protein
VGVRNHFTAKGMRFRSGLAVNLAVRGGRLISADLYRSVRLPADFISRISHVCSTLAMIVRVTVVLAWSVTRTENDSSRSGCCQRPGPTATLRVHRRTLDSDCDSDAFASDTIWQCNITCIAGAVGA